MNVTELNEYLKHFAKDRNSALCNGGHRSVADALETLVTLAGGVLEGINAKRELGRVGAEALKPTHHEGSLRDALRGVHAAASVRVPEPYASPEPDVRVLGTETTPLTSMAAPLLDDPEYGPALCEAARVNRVGGLKHGERHVDVNVLTIAIAKMAAEIIEARKRGDLLARLREIGTELGLTTPNEHAPPVQAAMLIKLAELKQHVRIPLELAEAVENYANAWRAPFYRTPGDRDSDLDRHMGEQLCSVWRRVKSGEIRTAVADGVRPARFRADLRRAITRLEQAQANWNTSVGPGSAANNERDHALVNFINVWRQAKLSFVEVAEDPASIIPPESPTPVAEKRETRKDLVELAGGTVLGIVGLEQSAYALRAGDRGVSLFQHAANAISFAMGKLIDTGEKGVRDAVILLRQIQHELMCERQAAKPLAFADRMFENRGHMGTTLGQPFVQGHDRVHPPTPIPPGLVSLMDKLLEPIRAQAAELERRFAEEVAQRVPVSHAVLDRAALKYDTVGQARTRLLEDARGHDARMSRPIPTDHERAEQLIIADAFALSIAVLRQCNGDYHPARVKPSDGYFDAVNTLERFRVRAEEGAKP